MSNHSRRSDGLPHGANPPELVGIPDAEGFIHDPRDADVLCGRGGAALRHPGNQTYRRLVALNKGLYVTCLKTEKLKISRSIVAAIREQNGRFLEKDGTRNAWFDIGEKKAVEKTSQALREGAPKLRQKMAEMQNNDPYQQGQTQDLNHPYPSQAAPDQRLMHQDYLSADLLPISGGSNHSHSRASPHDIQPTPILTNSPLELSNTGTMNTNTNYLPVGGIPNTGGNSRHKEMQMDMMQRLSLHDMQQKLAATQRRTGGLNHRVSLARELGITESQLSLMSEFSQFSSSITGRPSNLTLNHQHPQTHPQHQDSGRGGSRRDLDYFANQTTPSYLQPAGNYSFRNGASQSAATAHSVNCSDIDRRRVFAKMKYSRPPSVRSIKGGNTQGASQHSMDDLPDFNMVESNLSLFSLSSKMSLLDMKAPAAAFEPSSAPSSAEYEQQQQQQQQKVIVESALSNRGDFLAAGSRHSIMSGLSKISDSSIDNSIFSDLSRKIGNVSTRSVAMSEMSVMEDMELGGTEGQRQQQQQQQPIFSTSMQKLMTPTMDFDMFR